MGKAARRKALLRVGRGIDEARAHALSRPAVASEGADASEAGQAGLVDEGAHADRVGAVCARLLVQVCEQGDLGNVGLSEGGSYFWLGGFGSSSESGEAVVDVAEVATLLRAAQRRF